MRKRIIIMGSGGRDYHVFNTCYRDEADVEVVAFTTTEIPPADYRQYPPSLAGDLYPEGIPIHPESELADLIAGREVEEVVFACTGVPNEYVAERRVLAERAGAEFRFFDIVPTMLKAKLPVIAVCAVRTGCGKSATTRRVLEILREAGARPVVVRHPMPYGDLERQKVQRFGSLIDLDADECTLEQREEFEPHLRHGAVVFTGVDYGAVLTAAETEGDVLIWDGGNNDLPFFKPDLWITLADPHRAGDEREYFPGAINFTRADLILINKAGTAPEGGVEALKTSAGQINPQAKIVVARSPVKVDEPASIFGRRVLVIEDGPSVTHGGLRIGAGLIAAREFEAGEIVDPRPWAVGGVAETFARYPDLGPVLPAIGYDEVQIGDLVATINAVDCDLVLIATPVRLERMIEINKPQLRVSYELEEAGSELTQAVLQARERKSPAPEAVGGN